VRRFAQEGLFFDEENNGSPVAAESSYHHTGANVCIRVTGERPGTTAMGAQAAGFGGTERPLPGPPDGWAMAELGRLRPFAALPTNDPVGVFWTFDGNGLAPSHHKTWYQPI
jgi:hypothetical protein